MPQTIPSMVSKLRVVLRLSAIQASRMISTNIASACAGPALRANQAEQLTITPEALTTEDTKVHKGTPASLLLCNVPCGSPFYPPASNLKASIGSTDAALRAGYNAESTAIAPSSAHDSNPDFHVGSSPAKKSGMGSRSTSEQIP